MATSSDPKLRSLVPIADSLTGRLIYDKARGMRDSTKTIANNFKANGCFDLRVRIINETYEVVPTFSKTKMK
jgi:hypothetical protein